MVRTRIAPSPTGFPHIGTIYQAIFNKAWALKNGGKFILRLEDTDQKRIVEGSEKVIYESLAWTGLSPDEGPLAGGSFGPYRQSERLDLYKKQALVLIERGGAYYCFCSAETLGKMRAEQTQNHQPPLYDRRCRQIDLPAATARAQSGEACVVRLKMPMDQKIVVEDSIRGPIAFESNLIDDTVLLKSDGFPTYHLALVVDDHFMEITHPIRGEEWISSYPKHKVLFDYFIWPMPTYTHLPLLRNPDGSKISKRQGHTSVDWYKEQGILPETLVNFLILMVWKHPSGQEIFTLEEFAKEFNFQDISLTGPRFDLKKLEWMNGEYIRKNQKLNLKNQIYELCGGKYSLPQIERALPLVRERMKKLSEFEFWAGFLFERPKTIDKKNLPNLNLIFKALENLNRPWQKEDWEVGLRRLASELDLKPIDIFMQLRLALSGSRIGPDLFDSIETMGEEETLGRLKALM